MTRRNEAEIEAVRKALGTMAAASTGAIAESSGLTAAQVRGALRALQKDGVVVSEGNTTSRMHRLRAEGEAPATSGRRSRKKTRKGKATSPQVARQAAAPTAYDSIFAVGVTADRGLVVAGQPHGLRVFTPEQTLEIASAVFAHFEMPQS